VIARFELAFAGNALTIDERAILAAKIANGHVAFVDHQRAMMAAD